jgi:catechol 2,3-dioxygenase-like lactoylglutathione lyase family enzyme
MLAARTWSVTDDMEDDMIDHIGFPVSDYARSKAFYEKLDFKQVSGKLEQNWVVLQNGTTKIGLFQGMFEKNGLTFNPGWDHERKTPENFQDVVEGNNGLRYAAATFNASSTRGSARMWRALSQRVMLLNSSGTFMLSEASNTISRIEGCSNVPGAPSGTAGSTRMRDARAGSAAGSDRPRIHHEV